MLRMNLEERLDGVHLKREREAKAMVSWLLRVVFGEHQMSDLGRACLLEIGCNTNQ